MVVETTILAWKSLRIEFPKSLEKKISHHHLQRIRYLRLQNLSPSHSREKLNATLTLFETSNGINIELVQGLAVENFLKKKITLYHSCYEVDDIYEKIDVFLKAGAFIIVDPVPAILFEQRLVCFLMTPLGIVELLNKKIL